MKWFTDRRLSTLLKWEERIHKERHALLNTATDAEEARKEALSQLAHEVGVLGQLKERIRTV